MIEPENDTAAPKTESPNSALTASDQPPRHRWGLGAFLLVEAALLVSAAFISALLGRLPQQHPVPLYEILISTMVPTLVAALLAMGITVIRGNGPILDLHLAWRWDDVKVGFKFGAIGLVCTTAAAVLWTQLVGERNAVSAISSLANQPMTIAAAISLFLYIWLLGPICEEIIFRGLFWGAIEKMYSGSKSKNGEKWGRVAAFVLSTAVFAVSHLEPLRTTLLLVISIPIGLARFFTGRLLASIVAHQVNNFLPAVMLLLVGLGLMSPE